VCSTLRSLQWALSCLSLHVLLSVLLLLLLLVVLVLLQAALLLFVLSGRKRGARGKLHRAVTPGSWH